MMEKGRERNRRRGIPLTLREIDVVRELALGKTNKEIAADLDVSEQTVKFHLKSIQAKLGVASRVSVVVHALRADLIELPELE